MIKRIDPSDDTGATLILALIIITTIALVIGATLSLATTNVKSTVALRDQAATSYSADGAAQLAINQLRANTFNGVANGCGSSTTETLANFYPPVSGAAATSAAVQCTPDPDNSSGNAGGNTSPGSAMLSLGTGQDGEDGIWDGSSNNRTFKVSGGVFSNSNINLGGKSSGTGAIGNQSSVIENVSSDSYVFAKETCSGPGSIQVTGTTVTTCNYSTNPLSSQDRRGIDPQLIPGHGTSFDPPPAPTAAVTMPTCSGKKVYQLQAGLYADATKLNALTASGNSGPCAKSIVHFNPGTYYFNFTNAGTHKWTSSSAYVVAGTPTSTLKVNAPPAMTQASPACVPPGTPDATTSSGVLFVFGGDSRMDYTKDGSTDGDVEICASDAASGPPVAIYGLRTSIGSGTMQVPALTGCLTATPYVYGGDAGHCALIQSYQDPSPIFTVHGTVYAPTAPIDMTFNQSSAQYFQWGLVARTILISSTGSATALNNSVIFVPSDAPSPFPTPSIYYLNVYICPERPTCAPSGTPKLTAKVQLSTTTPTTATVLSWSQRR